MFLIIAPHNEEYETKCMFLIISPHNEWREKLNVCS